MTTSNGKRVEGNIPKPMFKKLVPTTQQRVVYELMTEHGVNYAFLSLPEKKNEAIVNPFKN